MDERQETTVEIRHHKHRRDEADLDITPMIDVTFLLLAFFVVVSKMDPSTAVVMPRAGHGIAVPDRSAVILVVAESDTEEPRVYLGKAKDDAKLATGSIEDIEDAIADYVQNAMLADQRKTTVIIKGERKVKYRHMHLVKQAVSRNLEEGQVINIGIEEE